MKPALIGFVIRTFNSSATLGPLLEVLSSEQCEVICVDSGSSDETVAIARAFNSRVLQLPPGGFTYGRALNVGFRAASTEWIVALSSHCIPAFRSFVADYCAAASCMPEDVAMFSGAVCHLKTEVRKSPTVIVTSDFYASEYRRHYVGNPNCCYRAEVVKGILFSEAAVASEDIIWANAALSKGYRIGASMLVPVLYRRPGSLRNYFLKGYREALQHEQIAQSAGDVVLPVRVGLVDYMRKCAYRLGRSWIGISQLRGLTGQAQSK